MNPSSTSRHDAILCGKVPPANQTTDVHPEWKLCFPVFSYFYCWTTRMKLARLLTALQFLSNIELSCQMEQYGQVILLWGAQVMPLHLFWVPILSNRPALSPQTFQCYFFHSSFLYKQYSALLLFLSTLAKSKPNCNGETNFAAV
jgi:hypothetical protein